MGVFVAPGAVGVAVGVAVGGPVGVAVGVAVVERNQNRRYKAYTVCW